MLKLNSKEQAFENVQAVIRHSTGNADYHDQLRLDLKVLSELVFPKPTEPEEKKEDTNGNA